MIVPGRLTGLLLALCLLLSCSDPVVNVQPGVSLELAESRAVSISALRYRLRFDIPEQAGAPVAARAEISFELADGTVPLQLDFRADEANIHAVRANGGKVDYRFTNEHIVIPVSALQTGRNVVEVHFTAGTNSLNRNPDYLFTLFVPDRARTLFPLFDQPDLKARYDLTLEIPATWTAVSSAPVSQIADVEGRAEWRFETSDLISSYVFSFVAGEFQSVTREVDGRAMTMLHRETDEEKLARNLDAIFDLHGASLAWLEEYTGIKYPFEKFDFVLIPDSPYGGMEHVGVIQYQSAYLLLGETPTDNELLGRAQVIAHETAHMWFGNLVTMRWFNDVWTKEVFASFMAGKIVEPNFPGIDHNLNFLVNHYPPAYAIDRSEGPNPIRQELPNLNEAGQMYGEIIYHKAPIMMRQLELLVGPGRLQAGMREYLQKFAYGNATWPDLVALLDAATDEDLATWSRVWVNTPGRPEFSSSTSSAGGYGYGLFPADLALFRAWSTLGGVEKGAALINNYENLLEGSVPDVEGYVSLLLDILRSENSQLLLQQALNQLKFISNSLLTDSQRVRQLPEIESTLWQATLNQPDSSRTRLFFMAYATLASSADAMRRLQGIWSTELSVDKLVLEEEDMILLAQNLAISLPHKSAAIVARQLANTSNPDRRRRLEFIAPSLAPEVEVRDAFFDSLKKEENRETESWVLEGLYNLHHPTRLADSEKYLQPSLELLQEIQVSGDIFFPADWLRVTLANHHSSTAVATVRSFLEDRPGYNSQLRMKILQEADPLFRANRIRSMQVTASPAGQDRPRAGTGHRTSE
jgi:aminopeptidase N